MDYLKIDIEGFENKAIKAMFLDEMLRNVKQIGLEVRNDYFLHYQLNKMSSFTVKKYESYRGLLFCKQVSISLWISSCQ